MAIGRRQLAAVYLLLIYNVMEFNVPLVFIDVIRLINSDKTHIEIFKHIILLVAQAKMRCRRRRKKQTTERTSSRQFALVTRDDHKDIVTILIRSSFIVQVM